MKTCQEYSRKWWLYIFYGLLAVIFASSAYVVYYNTAVHLPMSVSFFWFSLLAGFSSFLFPQNPIEALSNSNATAKEKWVLLYPDKVWKQWIDSLRSKKFWLIILAGICGFIYFFFLLRSIQSQQVNILITITILMQLSAFVHALLGKFFLKHKLNWTYYSIGVLIILVGALIYKNQIALIQHIKILDIVVFWTVLAIIADAVSWTACTRHEKESKVKPLHDIRSMQFICAILGALWVISDGVSFRINFSEFLALLYIGVIPTALAFTMLNECRTRIGMPLLAGIQTLRPFLIWGIGYLPFGWFKTDYNPLDYLQILGMLITMLGFTLIVFKGETEAPGS